MELVADYDVDITYHPGKANKVADVLSRRRTEVSARSTMEELIGTVSSLRLSSLSGDAESLGQKAVDQADLLTRIQEAQRRDEDLQMFANNDKTEYQVSSNGTIMVNGRVCVQNDGGLKEEILKEAHQSKFSIHPGGTKMYQDLKRYYHWVNMKRDVAEWVARCPTCQLVKAEHKVPSGLLQNLPIPKWKWGHVTMDFITGLPMTRRKKNTIWVVVDRLTKSAHFLAINKTDGAEAVASLYMNEIVRLHGIPVSIVSDRDTRFRSHYWRALQRALGTKVLLSTAYHPQTDGQSERTIQTLEDLLRACILDWGGSWDSHLPLAEFSYNNSYHASIGMSPYEALYGRPCKTPLCWTEVGERSMIGPEIVDETTQKIKRIQVKMREAQDRQKKYADRGRKQFELEVGDLVFLKTKVLKGKSRISSSGKLKPRYMGPYRVVERVGKVAYKLQLPEEMRAFHPTFHISQLGKCIGMHDEIISEPPKGIKKDLTIETEPDRIIDRMVKSIRSKNILMVKVVWRSGRVNETTWETEKRIKAEYPKWYEENGYLGFEDESLLRGGVL